MPRLFAFLFFAAVASAAEPFPLWDGQETIAHYAARTNLPPTKTLDLGNGVTLDLVLIPAGKFIMGTPEPNPVDEPAFQKQIRTGQIVFGIGAAILLLLIAAMLVRALRQRRRPQYSLALFLVMIVSAGVGLLGGMHWWHSARVLAQAQTEYEAALAIYKNLDDYESPAHEVTLTTPYYIGKFEVTQAQYQQVVGKNPSHFKGANLPVERVDWDDAHAFCRRVSEKTRSSVTLPTEAAWEHACRAGTVTTYYLGDCESDLGRAAWSAANSKNTTHPTGQKFPNAWGVYDMLGNVCEWCEDCFKEYKADAVLDPKGPREGPDRVLRGGAWNIRPEFCRPAYRFWIRPDTENDPIGFRVVVVVPGTP
ncbi:MAG TPA: formylglycine-generating enzyme family protein [Planctomycetota bacterium]|jgi:formylglycine-generating enzyme required for sulfatase activity